MVKAEKFSYGGRDWIRVSFIRGSKFLHSAIEKVDGARFNPTTKNWCIPYCNLSDFERKMGDYLILWDNDGDVTAGGIDEDSIPSQPIVTGYSVKYDSNGNIVGHTGFKTAPWGEFQVKGFNALVKKDFLILADDAGLGKSWQVTTAMEARKKMGDVKRGIILCKASLLFNWRDEIHMHTNEKAVIWAGTPMARAKISSNLCYSDDWMFIIMSYETYRTDFINIQSVDNSKPIDFCILDEAHKIKNPQCRIGTVLHYVPYRLKYVLTATPIPNTPIESYNYLRWGGKESRNWWAFRARYAIMGGANKGEIVGYKNIQELRDNIQRNMLRRLKKDKLKDLPDVCFKTIPIEMTAAQERLYSAVKKEIIEELKDTSLEKIPSALSKLLRLQQITDSPELIGSKEKSAKLNTLDDLLEDLVDEGGEKVIIFSRFRTMVDILTARYEKYNPAVVHGGIDANGTSRKSAEKVVGFSLQGKEREDKINEIMTSDRQREVYKFQQDSSCKIFIGSSGACREGLTLTAATNVIFLDCEWAWDYVMQAYSRAHRIGQKNAVTIYFLACKNTIDEYVLDVVYRKRKMSESIVDKQTAKDTQQVRARALIAALIGEDVKDIR